MKYLYMHLDIQVRNATILYLINHSNYVGLLESLKGFEKQT